MIFKELFSRQLKGGGIVSVNTADTFFVFLVTATYINSQQIFYKEIFDTYIKHMYNNR